MGTLIDSSVLIAVERGGLEMNAISPDPDHEDAAISAVTASELLHGLHRAATAVQRHRRQAFTEGILARLPVVAFDLEIARVHASLWATLQKRGTMIGERDLMIAATAIAKGYDVATRDKRSFSSVPGLNLRLL